jgi:hypothetical protein
VRRPATLRQLKGATGQRRDAGHERGTSAPRQTEQYRGEIGSASSGGVIGLAMPSKRTTKAPPSRADRAAEQADYATWKITAGADLLERHGVKPGVIPERLWRRLYIMGRTPQKAADEAAVSAYNTMSPGDRLKRLKR